MLVHGILGWLVIGVVAGGLVRLLPGRDPGGAAVTVLVGIAGALLAGFTAESVGWAPVKRTMAAAAGAGTLLMLYRLVIARRVR